MGPWSIVIPALLAAAPVALLAAGEDAAPPVTRRGFTLRLTGVDPGEIIAVSFWQTIDGGRTWRNVHEENTDGDPAARPSWRFEPKIDGRYGFATRVVYRDGRREPKPAPGEAPTAGNVVVVDLTPPEIVSCTRTLNDDLTITFDWEVRDPHLPANPVRFEWQDQDGKWWSMIHKAYPAKGRTKSKPREPGKVAAVRLVAADRPGNRAVGPAMPVDEPPPPPPAEPVELTRAGWLRENLTTASDFEADLASGRLAEIHRAGERPAEEPACLLWDARQALLDDKREEALRLYARLRTSSLADTATAEEMDLRRAAGDPAVALKIGRLVPPERELAPIHLARARALLAADRLGDAEASLAAVGTTDPRFSEAQYLKTLCLLRRKQDDAALRLLNYVATFNDAWGRRAVAHLLEAPAE